MLTVIVNEDPTTNYNNSDDDYDVNINKGH